MYRFFKEHVLNIAIALLVVGLFNALYLSYGRYMSVDLSCGATNGGCAIVAASPYAVMFGIPLAYLGVVFYAAMLGILLLSIFKPSIYKIKETLVALSIFGALDSLYFLYLQGYVINAFCIYCIISALITFALVPLLIFYYKFSARSI